MGIRGDHPVDVFRVHCDAAPGGPGNELLDVGAVEIGLHDSRRPVDVVAVDRHRTRQELVLDEALIGVCAGDVGPGYRLAEPVPPVHMSCVDGWAARIVPRGWDEILVHAGPVEVRAGDGVARGAERVRPVDVRAVHRDAAVLARAGAADEVVLDVGAVVVGSADAPAGAPRPIDVRAGARGERCGDAGHQEQRQQE